MHKKAHTAERTREAEKGGRGYWEAEARRRKAAGTSPDWGDLAVMEMDGVCEAVDGCAVEPDGYCRHGAPSWLIVYGLI